MYSNGYRFRIKITVKKEMVSGGVDIANFAFPIKVTKKSLRQVGLGGKVYNANGYDIIVTDSSNNQLSHEIEYYSPTLGTFIGHAKITAGGSADTILYLYYGNDSISTSQENITSVWSDNFVGVWHLNNTSYLDSTSNNTDLSAESSPAIVDNDYLYKGLDSNSGSLVDTTPSANIYQSLPTFECLCKLESLLSNDGPLVTIDGGFSGDGWLTMDLDSSERPYFRKSHGTGSGEYSQVTSPDALSLDTWYHIVATRPTTSTMRIYVNGVLKASISGTDTRLAGNNSNFRIGFRDSRRFLGEIDEVRIHSTPRSADYITTLYRSLLLQSTYVTYGEQEPLDSGGAFLLNFV